MRTWWWIDGDLHRMRNIILLRPRMPDGIFPQIYLDLWYAGFHTWQCSCISRLRIVHSLSIVYNVLRDASLFCPRAWNFITLVASQCSHIVENIFQQLHYLNNILGVCYSVNHCIYYVKIWGYRYKMLYFFCKFLNQFVIQKSEAILLCLT